MTKIPDALHNAIQAIIDPKALEKLIEAREVLTSRYRTPLSTNQFIENDLQRQAYIAARLPATFMAISEVLQAVLLRLPRVRIDSILDLGAGPGTAMWALCEYFPEIKEILLVERDSSLALLGKKLAQFSTHISIRTAKWENSDLRESVPFNPHDLIILSYSIGELDEHSQKILLNKCWEAAQQLLVVIEPGTPSGFERIRSIRQTLLKKGGHIIAPCPHQHTCPMVDKDWCHFAARVERSILHKKLKGGSLSYEDEKFSYAVFSKFQTEQPEARILRHPEKHSGHLKLKICTSKGLIEEPTISKKMGGVYKKARKAGWGETLNL